MDENAKKALLQFIPHGLYIVTTGAGQNAHGFTATWLTQVSFKPPLVALAVRRDSHAYTTISANASFVVNYIPKDAKAAAQRFLKPPRPENGSFREFAFSPSPATGGPVLEASLGYLDCKVVEIVDRGDHAVVLGEVLEAARLRDGEPLVLADTAWKYGG